MVGSPLLYMPNSRCFLSWSKTTLTRLEASLAGDVLFMVACGGRGLIDQTLIRWLFFNNDQRASLTGVV